MGGTREEQGMRIRGKCDSNILYVCTKLSNNMTINAKKQFEYFKRKIPLSGCITKV